MEQYIKNFQTPVDWTTVSGWVVQHHNHMLDRPTPLRLGKLSAGASWNIVENMYMLQCSYLPWNRVISMYLLKFATLNKPMCLLKGKDQVKSLNSSRFMTGMLKTPESNHKYHLMYNIMNVATTLSEVTGGAYINMWVFTGFMLWGQFRSTIISRNGHNSVCLMHYLVM